VGRGHDRTSEKLAAPSAAAGRAGGDPLSDVLRSVRLTGALYFLVDASSPWVEELPAAESFGSALLPGAQQIVSYHVVTRGPCWGALVDGPAVRLETGDIFLVPHGDAYALSSQPGMRGKGSVEEAREFFRQMAAGALPFVLTEGGGGADRFGVICGFLGCDARPFNPVLGALPRLVHVRRARAAADHLDPLIDFALAEARERRSGGQCMLVRLSELMFIEAIRRHLSALPAATGGWLAGLRDPDVGRALALLHAQTARPWTLETLAREAGVSRSVLADRFMHFVGQPPMRYLARWRMQVAARRLADGGATVSKVALEVGYDSEAAFSRAFKRIVGSSPAGWRRRQAAR
jgi:AraC-like DNA-binding protein